MLRTAQREFILRKDQGGLHKEGVILNVLKMPDNKKRKVSQGCVSREKEETPWQPVCHTQSPACWHGSGTEEARRHSGVFRKGLSLSREARSLPCGPHEGAQSPLPARVLCAYSCLSLHAPFCGQIVTRPQARCPLNGTTSCVGGQVLFQAFNKAAGPLGTFSTFLEHPPAL